MALPPGPSPRCAFPLRNPLFYRETAGRFRLFRVMTGAVVDVTPDISQSTGQRWLQERVHRSGVGAEHGDRERSTYRKRRTFLSEATAPGDGPR